jgi:hypothetical protein
VIAQHLLPEDAVTARLVCGTWAQDLGAFVAVAKTLPTELLTACCPAQAAAAAATAANIVSGVVGSSETSHTTVNSSGATSRAVSCRASSTSSTNRITYSTTNQHVADATSAQEGGSQQEAVAAADFQSAEPPSVGVTAQQQQASTAAVAKLLTAFPHCQTLHVDICNAEQQQLAALLLNSLAGCSTSTNAQVAAAGDSSSLHAASGVSCTTGGSQLVSVAGQGQQQQQQQCVQVPRVVVDAVARSFHCKARQDCPTSPPGALTVLKTGNVIYIFSKS